MEKFMKIMAFPFSIMLFYVMFKILFLDFIPNKIWLISTIICSVYYANSFALCNWRK
jgi:hypothetical protein